MHVKPYFRTMAKTDNNNSTLILDSATVDRILKRMAYQIYERNFDSKSIVIAAIDGRGAALAKIVENILNEISDLKTQFITVKLDKDNPLQHEVTLDPSPKTLAGKQVILFDDVLNSGRTMAYALIPFLSAGVKSVQTAVLVDRSYKNFPVLADYIGISLNTMLQEHVAVKVDKKKISVYVNQL